MLNEKELTTKSTNTTTMVLALEPTEEHVMIDTQLGGLLFSLRNQLVILNMFVVMLIEKVLQDGTLKLLCKLVMSAKLGVF